MEPKGAGAVDGVRKNNSFGRASIGRGIDVRSSNLANGKLGVFASRPFHDKEDITEYEGARGGKTEYARMPEALLSHARTLHSGHGTLIDGRENEVKWGIGAASWANDAMYHMVNGKFVRRGNKDLNKAGFSVCAQNRMSMRATKISKSARRLR